MLGLTINTSNNSKFKIYPFNSNNEIFYSIKINDNSNLSAIFDSKTQGLMAASTTIFAETQNFYGAIGSATETAAQIKDVGHAAKVLSWGRWTNGNFNIGNDNSNPVGLTANNNVHYLIGLPTPSNSIPNTGSVTYSLVGGTASAIFGTFDSNRQFVTSFDVGHVNNGNLMVDFGSANTLLNLGINGFTKANTLQSIELQSVGSLTANSNSLTFNSSVVTGNQGNFTCTECTVNMNGMFFGGVNTISNSTQNAPIAAGVSYNISGSLQGGQATSININGTAGFTNPTVTPQNNVAL